MVDCHEAPFPIVAYFDMNVWVEMAKGLKIGNPDWLAAADELKAAVRESRLVVPLSAAHYMELWHRRDQASREAVGALMRDIADYVSLSPIQRVRDLEVDALVDRHLGGRRRIEAPDLLARGVVHAFDSPYGRFGLCRRSKPRTRRRGRRPMRRSGSRTFGRSHHSGSGYTLSAPKNS